MKNTLMGAAVLCLITSTCAYGESFSGLTAGIQGGINSAKIKQDTTTSGAVTSNEVSSTNPGIVITGGWGEVIHSFYFGGEARITMTGGNTNTTTGPGTGSTISNKPGPNAVIAGRAGLLFTERAMGFVTLGVGMGEMTYTIQDANGTFTNKKRELIIVPGLGTEIALTDSLNARFDLSYSLGKQRTISSADLASAGIKSYTNATFKPSWINCSIGINYRF